MSFNSLVFAVHMWNPVGPEPETIWQVMHRQKDIQYSSRVTTHIARQAQIHRLRHVIRELCQHVPDALKSREDVRALAAYGCPTRMHVVRLLWPGLAHEDHTKDVDFSVAGIRDRWQAGYEKAMRAIELAPWRSDVDPIEGVFLHELSDRINAPALPPDKPAAGCATMEISDLACKPRGTLS
jgi:NTE family protein